MIELLAQFNERPLLAKAFWCALGMLIGAFIPGPGEWMASKVRGLVKKLKK